MISKAGATRPLPRSGLKAPKLRPRSSTGARGAAARCRATRPAKRRRGAGTEVVAGKRALSGLLSHGEQKKLSAAATSNYERCMVRYEEWRSSEGRAHDMVNLEVNILDYLDATAARGGKLGEIQTSVAAILHFTPGVAKSALRRHPRHSHG